MVEASRLGGARVRAGRGCNVGVSATERVRGWLIGIRRSSRIQTGQENISSSYPSRLRIHPFEFGNEAVSINGILSGAFEFSNLSTTPIAGWLLAMGFGIPIERDRR